MSARRTVPETRVELYSPVGLIPTDSFTGASPLGRLRVKLDLRDDGGRWRETGIREVRTPGGVIAYPRLGRSREIAGSAPRIYRVRIESEFYLPHYTKTAGGTLDGIEFKAFPYNDTNPPADYPKKPSQFPAYLKAVLKKVWLVPAPNYPFPAQVYVLRGVVVRAGGGGPVADAEVNWGNKEKALSAANGTFGLPLRVSDIKHVTDPQKIDARDPRKNQQGKNEEGTINVVISTDVGTNQTITIS